MIRTILVHNECFTFDILRYTFGSSTFICNGAVLLCGVVTSTQVNNLNSSSIISLEHAVLHLHVMHSCCNSHFYMRKHHCYGLLSVVMQRVVDKIACCNEHYAGLLSTLKHFLYNPRRARYQH